MVILLISRSDNSKKNIWKKRFSFNICLNDTSEVMLSASVRDFDELSK